MKTIWEFPVMDGVNLTLPAKARILSVIEQGENVVLYALVNDTERVICRSVRVLGTGWGADTVEGMEYVGTVSVEAVDELLIWHVFIGPELG